MGYLAILIQVTGLILLGQKIALGWLCGIAAELIWIKRGRDNRMPDLMTMASIYIGVALWNFWQWSVA